MDTTELKNNFEYYDLEAIKYKDAFNLFWISSLILALITVICFATNLFIHNPETTKLIIACIEIMCLLLSILLLTVVVPKQYYVYLLNRRKAEFIRYYKNIEEDTFLIDQSSLNGAIHEIENINYTKKKLGFEVNNIQNIPIREIKDISKSKDWAINIITDQLEYHKNKRIRKFTKQLTNAHIILSLLKYTFITIACLKFLLEVKIKEWISFEFTDLLHNYFCFLLITLPPLYAIIEGVIYFNEWKNDVHISKRMVTQLNKLLVEFNKNLDNMSCKILLTKLLACLNQENVDWLERFVQKEISAKIV